MKSAWLKLPVVLAVALAIAPQLFAENWPCFRGPSRQGVTTATGVPTRWSSSENIRWKTPIAGDAHSSPIVWENNIFLTTATDGGRSCRVVCVDAGTGAMKWDTEVFRQEPGRKESRNTYATPTPCTDGQRVYAVFGSGGFAAVDFSGKVVWTFRDFRFYSRHGLGASPVLEDGLLLMPWDWSTDPAEEGADKERVGWQLPWDRSFVFALDAATGKLAWKTMRGTSRIAHVTPNLWVDERGRKQLVSGAGDVIQGFDLKTGSLLWTAKNDGEGVTPSVLIADGIAVQANGYAGANSVRAFRLDGAQGDITESHFAWEQEKNAPKLPSMVYVAPHIYCVTEAGIAWCAEARSGEVKYRERLGGTFAASPIVAAGTLYITADDGTTHLLPAEPRFEVLASNPLGEKVQASPAIAGNRLLIRGERHLFCIGQ
ncbi:MAG: PQQ-binding-like beta-propeller repeat protein [Verrucomicrobiales bacterium]